ncbi:lysophospholipase L1-like esterase [Allocatelliglobosispora scoriae]|uniref:Lysophospholipase L1-like esterase n=1 Tax=Allocatelliglobosispora scoriae TaxID=643052 RepID=A0A841C327_9ACTN|nr:GDSL-type esterase/lipase family protein [Allocatelliglobosispora scoriae]MBB5873360.1 lysophospholipase L1-like esterase [Allocatelliglobosispora scoriae]
MITNSAASKVLCFGDSNTNGIPSDDEDYARLAADVRWTGRLQLLLGDGYDVIEEGLGGRTTDLEYDDRPGCNGRPYFGPCLRTHHPIDVIVIMLGTNDLKIQFDRAPASIAGALHGYIDDVALNAESRSGGVPGIVLVSPLHLDDGQPRFAGTTAGAFDGTSVEKSRLLAAEISRVAHARGVLFADAATVARAGSDGHHLSVGSHERLAELIAGKVRDLVK